MRDTFTHLAEGHIPSAHPLREKRDDRDDPLAGDALVHPKSADPGSVLRLMSGICFVEIGGVLRREGRVDEC